MIELAKRKTLTVLSFLAIVLISSLIYISVSTPRFKISINPADPRDMGVEERLEDFEYLYNLVQENYPYLRLKERTHGYDWLDLKGVFEERIRDASDNEGFLMVIVEAVEALQNRHSQVLDPESVSEYNSRFQDSYPMNVVFCNEVAEAAGYWSPMYDTVMDRRRNLRFDVRIVYDRGDYIITDYYGSPLPGFGVKVTEVNGVPVDDAVKTCLDRDFIDRDFERGKPYLWRIAPHDFGADAVFTVLDSNGQEADFTFHASEGPSSFRILYPGPVVSFDKNEEEGVAYIYVKSFDLSTVEPYYDDVMDFYLEIEDYDFLIIDIRGNTGGTFQTWVDGIVRPLIKEDKLHEYYLAYRTGDYVQRFHEGWLSDRAEVSKDEFDYLPPEVHGDDYEIYNFSCTYTPTHSVDFEGEIILLTDNVVYSAAEGFTNFCKQTGFATIYGTPSGGDGFFVWPLYCVLPNSKIVVTMSSSMSLDSKGRANEEARTRPDVLHESPFMAHDELIDFVLEDILKGR